MARCLLITSGLPTKFWSEAVHMANIIYNMVPGAANKFSALQLKWDGTSPDVSCLRTFGCRVLVKDPADKLGKFSVCTWDGIYLGPAAGGDGHKIFDPQTKRVNVSRDVFFLEGRGKPEFTTSPILEKVPGPSEDQGEEKEEDEYTAHSLTFPSLDKKGKQKVRKAQHKSPTPPTPESPAHTQEEIFPPSPLRYPSEDEESDVDDLSRRTAGGASGAEPEEEPEEEVEEEEEEGEQGESSSPPQTTTPPSTPSSDSEDQEDSPEKPTLRRSTRSTKGVKPNWFFVISHLAVPFQVCTPFAHSVMRWKTD